METHDLILTGVLIPVVTAAIWCVKWVLGFVYKMLDRWDNQLIALENLKTTISEVGVSVAEHDRKNGVAHKQAAEILSKVADKLDKKAA